MPFEKTPAHEAIFAAFKAGERNMIIEAVAGSGKTTTVVEAINEVPPSARILFLAFNKDIATELKNRTPANVEASTLNSLGFRSLMAFFREKGVGKVRIEDSKTIDIGEKLVDEHDLKNGWGKPIKQLVGLAKSLGVIPTGGRHKATHKGLMPDSAETWDWIIERWGVDMPEDDNLSEEAVTAHVVGYVRAILDAGLRSSRVIDFDDQLYMAMAFEVPVKKYDRVVVDEVQDLNNVQREIAAWSVSPGGIICGVGDSCQSIYGFRGADSESMANFKTRFDARSLPLHVSYRCPQAVVAEAQKVVSHIKAHSTALVGLVEPTHAAAKHHAAFDFVPGDMVVCRMSAPLMRVALGCIKRGTPAKVLGRKVGEGLLRIVRKMKTTSIDQLEERLNAWHSDQVDRLSRKKNTERKIADIGDQVECIKVFIEICDSVDDMLARMDRMFTDAKTSAVVTLCTVHKSKGLEADRVFIINRQDMPSRMAKQEWELVQERNLVYVAITRAKRQLGYVRSE